MRYQRGPAPPPFRGIMDSTTTTRLSIPDASRLLGIPEATLRSRIAAGTLRSYRIDGYHVLVDLEDIAAWASGWASQDRRGENARRVVALHSQGYTDRNISATLAITVQRVSQLRLRAGLTAIYTDTRGAHCRTCGVRFDPDRRGQSKCPAHRRQAAAVLSCRCQACDAAFTRPASSIRRDSPGRYCSRACRDQAKRGKRRTDSIDKVCSECGRKYQGLASSTQTMCHSCRLHAAYTARVLRSQQG